MDRCVVSAIAGWACVCVCVWCVCVCVCVCVCACVCVCVCVCVSIRKSSQRECEAMPSQRSYSRHRLIFCSRSPPARPSWISPLASNLNSHPPPAVSSSHSLLPFASRPLSLHHPPLHLPLPGSNDAQAKQPEVNALSITPSRSTQNALIREGISTHLPAKCSQSTCPHARARWHTYARVATHTLTQRGASPLTHSRTHARSPRFATSLQLVFCSLLCSCIFQYCAAVDRASSEHRAPGAQEPWGRREFGRDRSGGSAC